MWHLSIWTCADESIWFIWVNVTHNQRWSILFLRVMIHRHNHHLNSPFHWHTQHTYVMHMNESNRARDILYNDSMCLVHRCISHWTSSLFRNSFWLFIDMDILKSIENSEHSIRSKKKVVAHQINVKESSCVYCFSSVQIYLFAWHFDACPLHLHLPPTAKSESE